ATDPTVAPTIPPNGPPTNRPTRAPNKASLLTSVDSHFAQPVSFSHRPNRKEEAGEEDETLRAAQVLCLALSHHLLHLLQQLLHSFPLLCFFAVGFQGVVALAASLHQRLEVFAPCEEVFTQLLVLLQLLRVGEEYDGVPADGRGAKQLLQDIQRLGLSISWLVHGDTQQKGMWPGLDKEIKEEMCFLLSSGLQSELNQGGLEMTTTYKDADSDPPLAPDSPRLTPPESMSNQ
ncbi:hypothetical protein INR49_029018, partial [Caranx melampygus]